MQINLRLPAFEHLLGKQDAFNLDTADTEQHLIRLPDVELQVSDLISCKHQTVKLADASAAYMSKTHDCHKGSTRQKTYLTWMDASDIVSLRQYAAGEYHRGFWRLHFGKE